MSQNLILVSDQKNDVDFAAQLANLWGFRLMVSPFDPERAYPLPPLREGDSIFFRVTTADIFRDFEKACDRAATVSGVPIDPNCLHYLSPLSLTDLPFLARSSYFGQLIQCRSPPTRLETEFYARAWQAGRRKESVRLSQLLPHAKIREVPLLFSREKKRAASVTREFASTAKFPPRIVAKIASTVDEFLMNAIFDARPDQEGAQALRRVLRNEEIELTGRAAVKLQLAYNKNYFVALVTDQFGSLQKSRMLDHLTRQCILGKPEADEGAGLGLAHAYLSGGCLWFACERNILTQVAIFFPRAKPLGELKNGFRFLATFFHG